MIPMIPTLKSFEIKTKTSCYYHTHTHVETMVTGVKIIWTKSHLRVGNIVCWIQHTHKHTLFLMYWVGKISPSNYRYGHITNIFTYISPCRKGSLSRSLSCSSFLRSLLTCNCHKHMSFPVEGFVNVKMLQRLIWCLLANSMSKWVF